MKEIKIGAGARATVLVEVSSLGSWGGDCTIEQIHKQAAEAAEGRIRNLVHKNEEFRNIRIISVAVTAVSTEKETL